MGYLEPIVTTGEDIFKLNRKKSVWISLGLIFAIGFATIMGNEHGPWSQFKVRGMNIFDFADFLSGNVMMPLGALILILYAGYVWKFKNYQAETNIGAKGFKVYDWWKPLVMVLIPIALLFIFINCVFL